MKKKLSPRLNTSSSYPSTMMKFFEIIYVKYMYIDRYYILFNIMLNQHTLVHIRINLLNLVSIKSFEWYQLFLNFVQNFEKTVMTQKPMRLDVSRNVRFTLKIYKIVYFQN